MEEAVRVFAERGDVIGLFAAIIVGGLGYHLKRRVDGKDAKPIDLKKDPIERVLVRVKEIDDRLVRVEADVENMPTRQEFHMMDKSVVRLDTRLAGIERTAEKTGHAVGRIEDFMLKVAGQGK